MHGVRQDSIGALATNESYFLMCIVRCMAEGTGLIILVPTFKNKIRTQAFFFHFWRKGQDSNLRDVNLLVFKTSAINHSATLPSTIISFFLSFVYKKDPYGPLSSHLATILKSWMLTLIAMFMIIIPILFRNRFKRKFSCHNLYYITLPPLLQIPEIADEGVKALI